MYSALMAVAIIGSAVFQVPIPPPIPGPEPDIRIPAGTVPWAMPSFPPIDIDLGLGTPSFDEVDHGDDYDDNLDEIESRVAVGTGIEDDIETEMDDWIGDSANIPDLSSNDFDTGIDLPGYEDMTAYDVASELGGDIGTMFAQIRSLTTIDVESSGLVLVIALLVLCIAWMILVQMIVFAIQFIDMAWSVITTIIELIPMVE